MVGATTQDGLQLRHKVPALDAQFKEERPGWNGYVEWEQYPEKKKKAREILSQYQFPDPPEFQLNLDSLKGENPMLEGVRWKQYFQALGGKLAEHPDISWKYVKEEKSEDMLHVLQFPYNGEPPRDRLMKSEITDNKDFFVRNHGGVPEIDEDAYTLDIEGLVNEPKRLTLEDLKNESLFKRQTNVSSIQCSGTRRIEQISKYPGDGDELINAPWGEGAIGTARWTGVSLKKVIKYCGGLKNNGEGIHLEFFGADTYFKKGDVFNYAVSVPWRKVKVNEVLLAWEMNGKPLPRIHGYPLRVVVFGYIGARSCKWLYKIKAINGPSSAPVQKKEYIHYTTQIGKQNALYSNGFSIQNMPVSSAIIAPLDKQQIVHDGTIKFNGWAFSGGGNWPVRVEVSMDGGNIWYQVPPENLTTKYFYAWRLWHYDVPVDAEGWLEFVVRTWDSSLNTQPTFQRSAWNWDMHVTSACHRISIYSINRSKPATAKRLAEIEKTHLPLLPITLPLAMNLETDEHYDAAMKAQGGRDPQE